MSEFKFSCPACRQKISCDTALAGTDISCPSCKALIVVPKEIPPPAGISGVPGLPPGRPGAGAAASQAAPKSTGQPAASTAQGTSGLAVASLVCSLASLVTCIGWLPGIICGHMAKSRIRRNPALKGSGLATTGLAIGYLILVLEVATVGAYVWNFSRAVRQGIVDAQHDLATNHIVITQTQPPATDDTQASPTRPKAVTAGNPTEPGNSGWTTDLSQMTFPNHPASGEIRGMNFKARNAVFHPAGLRIISAGKLFLDIHGLGDTIEGKSFEVQTTDAGKSNPRVQITWSEGDASPTVVFPKGYAMKLQFDQAVNGTVAGKIYLCLPDDSKSWVAGAIKVKLLNRN